MAKRQIILGSALLGIGVALVFELTPLQRWLDGVSDALWWDLLPWAMLALLWAVIGAMALRERARRSRTDQP